MAKGTALAPAGGRSVAAWAKLITAQWRETVEGILNVGRLLLEACAEIKARGGDIGELLGREPHVQRLPFGIPHRLSAHGDRWRSADCVPWDTNARVVAHDVPNFKAFVASINIDIEAAKRAQRIGALPAPELGKAALAKVAKTAKASPEIPDKAPAIDSLDKAKSGNGAPAQG